MYKKFGMLLQTWKVYATPEFPIILKMLDTSAIYILNQSIWKKIGLEIELLMKLTLVVSNALKDHVQKFI